MTMYLNAKQKKTLNNAHWKILLYIP